MKKITKFQKFKHADIIYLEVFLILLAFGFGVFLLPSIVGNVLEASPSYKYFDFLPQTIFAVIPITLALINLAGIITRCVSFRIIGSVMLTTFFIAISLMFILAQLTTAVPIYSLCAIASAFLTYRILYDY